MHPFDFTHFFSTMENRKPIGWFEWYYEVSSLWRVKWLARTTTTWRFIPERISSSRDCSKSYNRITLNKDGKRKTIEIHRLLWLHFIDKPEHCTEVNHIDWNKNNNSLENLERCTRTQNLQHAWDTWLRPRKYNTDKPNTVKTKRPRRGTNMVEFGCWTCGNSFTRIRRTTYLSRKNSASKSCYCSRSCASHADTPSKILREYERIEE